MLSNEPDPDISPDEETQYKTCFPADFYTIPFLTLILIFTYLGLSLYILGLYYKKSCLFPIKGRAPILATLQGVCFILTIFIPFMVEGLLRLNVMNWESTNPIPPMRYFYKSLFYILRLMTCIIWVFRTVYICSVWKLKTPYTDIGRPDQLDGNYKLLTKPRYKFYI
jgi:hypothetical protein